ncbi:MAG: hypothetical protein KDI07_22250 [Anaerolineae bacterium]|nr:hypothetical protein [Anaerolineae bacterium]
MSVAQRSITRVQDADDFGSIPGAGNDGYALTWDDGAGEFVLTAAGGGVTDHGALTGLSDDDHSQYLLATGARTGASSQAQTFTNGIIGPSWKPASDSTTALQLQNAAGTSLVNLDTSNSRVGISTASPGYGLDVQHTGNLLTAYFYNPTASTGKTKVVMRAGAGNSLGGGSEPVLEVQNSAGTQTAFVRADGLIASTLVGTKDDNSVALVDTSKASGSYPVGVNLGSSAIVGWSSGAWYSAKDTTITRGAAGKVYIGSSSGGSAGTLVAASVGAGTASPSTTLHALTTDSGTSAVVNVATVGHNSSGTAAAGFGGGLAFNLQSSTTASQSAGLIASSWIVATHASRTARMALSAYDYNSAREGMRIDTDGSQALLGFYAHSAVAQQVLATGAGATVDNVISALQALGLVKQS